MTLLARVDDDSAAVVANAAESLANRRGLLCPDDPGVRLHTLASLARQIDATLAAAIEEALRHEYEWGEIAELLDTTVTAAKKYLTRSPV